MHNVELFIVNTTRFSCKDNIYIYICEDTSPRFSLKDPLRTNSIPKLFPLDFPGFFVPLARIFTASPDLVLLFILGDSYNPKEEAWKTEPRGISADSLRQSNI